MSGIERARVIASTLLGIKLVLASHFEMCGEDYWTQPIAAAYDRVWLDHSGRPTFLFCRRNLCVYSVRPDGGVMETQVTGSLVRHRTYSDRGVLIDTKYVTRGDGRWN